MEDIAITTVDNPFDPFTQFDDWKRFDEAHGYYSCNLLARVALTTDDLSEQEEKDEIEKAIDDICRVHGYSLYKKVVKSA